MTKKYTPTDIQHMSKLQSDGYTAQEIADHFATTYPGITRCAVLGVLFRWRNKGGM